MKKEDFLIKLRNDYPDDEAIERTKQIIKLFNIKSGKELTKLYLKRYVILLADVFEKIVKVSTEEYGINPLTLCTSTWLYLSMCFEIY